MPETRYREVYEQGTGKLLKKEPYEVSDEELEREALLNQLDRVRKKAKADWTTNDIKDLLEALLELGI